MKNFQQTPKQKRISLSKQKAQFNAPKKTISKVPLAKYIENSGLWPYQRLSNI